MHETFWWMHISLSAHFESTPKILTNSPEYALFTPWAADENVRKKQMLVNNARKKGLKIDHVLINYSDLILSRRPNLVERSMFSCWKMTLEPKKSDSAIAARHPHHIHNSTWSWGTRSSMPPSIFPCSLYETTTCVLYTTDISKFLKRRINSKRIYFPNFSLPTKELEYPFQVNGARSRLFFRKLKSTVSSWWRVFPCFWMSSTFPGIDCLKELPAYVNWTVWSDSNEKYYILKVTKTTLIDINGALNQTRNLFKFNEIWSGLRSIQDDRFKSLWEVLTPIFALALLEGCGHVIFHADEALSVAFNPSSLIFINKDWPDCFFFFCFLGNQIIKRHEFGHNMFLSLVHSSLAPKMQTAASTPSLAPQWAR